MSAAQPLDDIKARVHGHTEGPWRTWRHGSGPRDSGVETTWAHDGDEPVQITDWCFPADAELIAAAPKLLAALEAVEDKLRLLDAFEDAPSIGRHNVNAAGTASVLRQAIAEALA